MQAIINPRLYPTASKLIIVISIAVFGLVTLLAYAAPPDLQVPFNIYVLPKFHAILNAGVTVCLIAAFVAIMQKNVKLHMTFTGTAFVLSTIFLLSYVTYHTLSESTKFGDVDADGVLSAAELAAVGSMRTVYFVILLSHIVLAAGIFPLILYTFLTSLTGRIQKHKKLVRYTLPLWLYVSVTGVFIYFMISPYYPA